MSAAATQFVLYSNDAVEVMYTDGCKLQMSPCGSAFVHDQPPGHGQHTLHGIRRIQQRCIYVTSEFREKVLAALEFRNRFAERPYLCRELIARENILSLHADIVEVSWSSTIESIQWTLLDSGSVKVIADEEFSHLVLSSHGQDFTVHFLAKLSQKRPRQLTESLEMSRSLLQDGYKADNKDGHQGNNRAPSRVEYMTASPELNKRSISVMDEPDGNDTLAHGEAGKSKWDYVWMSQHFSLKNYPECWRQPLKLAEQIWHRSLKKDDDSREGAHSSGESDGDIHNDNCTCQLMKDSADADITQKGCKFGKKSLGSGEKVNYKANMCSCRSQNRSWLESQYVYKLKSSLPHSLPSNCSALHLHKWKAADAPLVNLDLGAFWSKVKVACIGGVVYRCLYSPSPCIEIYPGDGSLLRSQGAAGVFFTQYIYKEGKVEERVHSVKTPPPDTAFARYSVRRLIRAGAQLLNSVLQDSLSLSGGQENCCWKETPKMDKIYEPLSTVLLEEAQVDGIGRFLAYSDGRIRITFTDRTCLNMLCDFSRRVNVCKKHSPDKVGQMVEPSRHPSASLMYRGRPSELVPGLCRLLLPSGVYKTVPAAQPGNYAKYVRVAEEWAEWVNTLPGERQDFYKDTVYDPVKQRSIQSELKKIQCFNYILENSHPFTHLKIDNQGRRHPESQVTSHVTSHVTVSGQQENWSGGGSLTKHMDMETSVRMALQRSKQALQDIDNILASKPKILH
ncbi:uncharacterized protein C5orf34 homolog [Lingula anatina]|uniref:Uncharacterized protein C5orf34 homolog n=1 Tax=Lingula anatina TaxID=7574 RepID=A0A1S3KG27_LINAN|nr:uncharacterized protein C5orf34 homolog [Lingula anatina]|eukprot:XP_013421186.1 uncharacterized protein C5orf34 homolog [Lingula anatina]